MTALGTLQMLLLAGLAFSALAGLCCSLAVPLAVRWTSSWAPASRHSALFVVALAPLAFGCAALLSALLPSLLGLHWPEYDHCLVHAGHSHLCFVHSSHHAGGLAGWLLLSAVCVWLGAKLVRGSRALLCAMRVVRELSSCAARDTQQALWVVPSSALLCLSVGLAHPRMFISRGLLANTSSDELEIMLAHEHAHARRKDSLVRLIARGASLWLLPGARTQLLATLDLAAEQACDEQAVLRAGDRLRVAETILAVERRLCDASTFAASPLVAAFGASSVPERVEAMLQPRREAGACMPVVAALVAIVGVVLGAHEQLHHTTESLLAVFGH